MAWLRLKAISVIAPKRAYFECFDQLIIWNSVAKALQSKKSKDVKQVPERPNKELEIMEDISKSLELTPSRDDSFGLLVATKIKKLFPKKKLSPKKKMKIKFEINNLLFTYQEDDDAAAVPQPQALLKYKHKPTQHFIERTMGVWLT